MISFTHFRHGTSILNIDGKTILIDPLFAPKGSYPPVFMTHNDHRNPLIDLPVDYQQLLDVNGVLVTHGHNDHFDKNAQEVLPKNIPLICQAWEAPGYCEMGFTNCHPIDESLIWNEMKWSRIEGTHGGRMFNKRLGRSSSYLISNQEGIKILVTGDTLLTGKQKKIIRDLNPHIIIANGGKATLKWGGKITMSHKDILCLSRICPDSQIYLVHLDSYNHCKDTSDRLSKKTDKNKNIILPEVGKTIICYP
ncbi:MBL fold metallo-hydrolase [Spirochaeta cellobiosiphila]|uniref:MBL fold metallo-hydrolase n=1 Tax=Spirochaeta cellobiosiphila TaxID=504483 RepID=UPI00041206A0|nr:MBL fold metallo-hydrolase [Spirochaeta cellobiosiphila]